MTLERVARALAAESPGARPRPVRCGEGWYVPPRGPLDIDHQMEWYTTARHLARVALEAAQDTRWRRLRRRLRRS